MNDKNDDRFYRTLYDKNGKVVRVLKEQLGEECVNKHSGFGMYESPYRHCSFCGNLMCGGDCFK